MPGQALLLILRQGLLGLKEASSLFLDLIMTKTYMISRKGRPLLVLQEMQ
jgi:hypothetical protein